MPLDFLPVLVLWPLAVAGLFYVPGRVLAADSASSLPRLFHRVLWSTIVSTLTATLLAAAAAFSLPRVLAANLVVSVALRPLMRRLADGCASPAPAPRRDRVGPWIFVLAVAANWPGHPVFLGSADSSAYIATGVSLAHHGHLFRDDALLGRVPPPARPTVFDSMSQVFGSSGPPYRRVPGAMLAESLTATRAWPDFFPVPSVWSALFVQTRATGRSTAEEAAPNYAPVFAALALWAFWLLAREWLGTGYAGAAVLLLAASAPFLMSARLPMSEGIAACFVLSALAALSAGGARLRPPDAALAGAALGATVFTRVETALFVMLALALQPSLAGGRGRAAADATAWRPTATLLVALAAVAALTAIPAATVPGTWLLPLVDHLSNAQIRLLLNWGWPTAGEFAVGAGIATTLVGLAVRHFGWSATLRWTLVSAVLAGHAAESRYLAGRTPMWLSFSVGWQGLVLAAVGALATWRRPSHPAASSFVLALFLAAAAILFYNPHVYPLVPWGARRFVPMLLPLLLLLACSAAARFGARSRLAGLVAVALLAWPVVTGGRPLWGRLLAEGTFETLANLDRAIPNDGVIFVDRDLSPLMVAPSLWLVRDRNNITVPPPGSYAAIDVLPGLVWYFAKTGPVYLVTQGATPPVATSKVRMRLLDTVPASLLLSEYTYNRRPEKMVRLLKPIAVYRLEPSLHPNGEVIR